MELRQNWVAICKYLLSEWKTHQDSPELCTLLMQQSMSYILTSDNGSSPYSCLHNNLADESRSFYQSCFVEAASYGMHRHLQNKYFLWQMCYYLGYFPTYYPIFLVVEPDKVETRQKELLAHATKQFSGSHLFLPWITGIGYYEWLHELNSDQLMKVHSEIQEFDLEKNSVDEDIRELFLLPDSAE